MLKTLKRRAASRRPRAIVAAAAALALVVVALAAGLAFATSPPAVTGLTSSTHPVEANWYSNNKPYVYWDAALANDAAVAGYSYVLDTDPATVPDTVVDVPSLTFGSNWNYAMADGCRSVTIADFNGDGRKDMATANAAANSVTTRLNSSSFSFVSWATYTTGTAPCWVAAADFNGDTKQDLVTANSGADSVSVLLGSGAGSFGAKNDFTTGTGPNYVAVGQLNGDANADLVTANYTANTVSVLLGNGNGTFQAKTDYAVGTGPYGVAIGDLNGDSNKDLVVANFDAGTVSVLLGTATGTFGAETDYSAGNGTASVAVADFNGDGKIDVMTANNGPSTVSVLLGNGDGTLRTKVDYATGLNPYGLAIADLNADGKLDLATADYGLDKVTTVLGNGDGTFGMRNDCGNFSTGCGLRGIVIADVNNDSKLDMVTANSIAGNASVLLNTRTPAVSIVSSLADGIWYFHLRVVDSQGVGGVTITRAVRVDVTAPTEISGLGSGTHPIASEWYANQNPSFFWSNSTDATSGMAGYSYVLDQSAATNPDASVETTGTTTAFEGRTDGTWYFHIRGVDQAGNVTLTVHRMAKIDTTPPVTTQSGADGAWHDVDVTVTLVATDAASGMTGGLAKTEWSTDGGLHWTQGTVVTVAAPLGGSNDGSHTILYRSIDKLGNTESMKSCEVKIDTLSPISTLGATPEWIKGPLTVDLTAVDAGCGVASRQYRFDGGLWAKGSSVTIPAPSDHSFDGIHMIDYRSVDVLFNVEALQSRIVGVDTRVPVTTTSNDGSWHAGLYTVTLSPVDDGSGMSGGEAKTEWSTDGGTSWNRGTTVAFLTWKRGAGSGQYELLFRSTDRAGNVEASGNTTVKMDGRAPATTNDAPSGAHNHDVTVHFAATDADSGAKETWYAVDDGAWTQGTQVTITAAGNNGVHWIRYYSIDNAGNQETREHRCSVTIDSVGGSVAPRWTPLRSVFRRR